MTKREVENQIVQLVNLRNKAEQEALGWSLSGHAQNSKLAMMMADSYNKRIAEILADLAEQLPV